MAEEEANSSSEAYPMIGGDGPCSYARNSSTQREAAERSKKELITSIVENLDMKQVSCPISNSFKIADLGCSIGPNTFIAMSNIIEAIIQKHKLTNSLSSLPEFQVFFNDHITNDFNFLFLNLPQDRQYYAAGVPGSFHGKLFPKASLNFVYSAYSLQWLSKAPKELGEVNNPSCNKGRIYYHNAPIEVGQAYYLQFEKDMKVFLDSRAHELTPGGLMALLIPGRLDGKLPKESSLGPLFEPLEAALIDLANEGKISRDKIDSFNLPIYSPSEEELKSLVEKNGFFKVVILQIQPAFPVSLLSIKDCRTGLESIITKHFGDGIIEQLFHKYSMKIEGRPPLTVTDEIAKGFFILLKRN